MKRAIKAFLRRCAILIGSWAWVPNYLKQITAADKFLQRKTKGAWSLLRIASLPGVRMTVVGKKSGLPRTTPLLCTPYKDGVLIAGSNFGGPATPAWVGNLRAAGEAEVRFNGVEGRMIPRELEGEERAEAWVEMLKTWPNYRLYEQRTDRLIPVFWLTTDGSGPNSGSIDPRDTIPATG